MKPQPTETTEATADISFESSFDKTIKFGLRFIFVSEEKEFDQQISNIDDADEASDADERKHYVYVDTLAKFSTPKQGADIKDKYRTFTAKNQRIILDAIYKFRSALNGNGNFF